MSLGLGLSSQTRWPHLTLCASPGPSLYLILPGLSCISSSEHHRVHTTAPPVAPAVQLCPPQPWALPLWPRPSFLCHSGGRVGRGRSPGGLGRRATHFQSSEPCDTDSQCGGSGWFWMLCSAHGCVRLLPHHSRRPCGPGRLQVTCGSCSPVCSSQAVSARSPELAPPRAGPSLRNATEHPPTPSQKDEVPSSSPDPRGLT